MRGGAMNVHVEANGIASVHLTLAMVDYEHVREIAQGLVRADGITLTPLIFPSIEEITFRFTNNLEWDVSELSFAKYISLTSQGAAPMVAIPVFPSRVHRHSAIYVRADRGIKAAKDLEGCAVGVPEWAQTAGIYARGILAEEFGVDLSKIRWLQAGVNEPGRAPRRRPMGLGIPGRHSRSSRQAFHDRSTGARSPACEDKPFDGEDAPDRESGQRSAQNEAIGKDHAEGRQAEEQADPVQSPHGPLLR